jgi:hypothetical protein
MPTDVTFVPDLKAWQKNFKSWNPSGVLGGWMTTKMKVVQTLAIAEAPGPGKTPRNRTGHNYATGDLESSISVGHGSWGAGELEGTVVAAPKHAIFVHNGTKPHIILPKRAKVLKFKSRRGLTVFAKKVNHPGTSANPFMKRALDQAIR